MEYVIILYPFITQDLHSDVIYPGIIAYTEIYYIFTFCILTFTCTILFPIVISRFELLFKLHT